MPVLIKRPEPAGPPTPAPAAGGVEGWVDTVTGWASHIPNAAWPITLGLTFVITLIALPALRRQAFRAGKRTAATKTARTAQDRRDRQLLATALTPAVLFWLAVLIGSGRGLIGFARVDLKWVDGWEYLVPFTLDGVAVSFGVLAFRAIAKGRNPDRAYRIVWMATIASAAINFLHEVSLTSGSALGAGYLAILSLFGMLIFHEFLAQFEDGAAWIKRDNPKFGMRWLTWPTNTACAWVAWRNYAPAEGAQANVGSAIVHLEQVRERKARRRAERFTDTPWWTPALPWIRILQLDAKLTEQRSAEAAERAKVATLNQRITTLAERLDDAERRAAEAAERIAAAGSAAEAERTARLAAEQETERLRDWGAGLSEQLRQVRAEHAALKAKPQDNGARSTTRTPRAEQPPAKAGAAKLTDEQAVELMLAEHPKPGYEWGSREVHRLTGAGFGRIPKLIAAVAEHHAREAGAPPTEQADAGSDDSKEKAS